MKETKILLYLIFGITICKAQTVYIHNAFPPPAIKINLYEDGNKINKLSPSTWFKWNNPNNKQNVEFKVKAGLYKNSLNIDLKHKKVVYVYILQHAYGIDIYEKDISEAPIAIRNDYGGNKIQENIVTHPKTEWTEAKIKQKLGENADAIEGIYENSFTSYNSARYKLGVIKEKDIYKIIYLSGGDERIWSEGDLKAVLIETATPYFYKTNWYMHDKSQNDETYINFKQGIFTSIFSNGTENIYIKLFLTASSGSNNSITSSGTGFALSQNGYIATNHHVINEAKSITVKGINGDFSKSYKAKLIIEDKNNDLAIIQIDDPNFSTLGIIPFVISNKPSDVGCSTFCLGYPLRATMGDEVKLTNGIISSKSGFQGDITTYQISAPVQPGNSGGPLFDDKGNLVGIISAKHLGAENVSYAIKISYLLNLIDIMTTPPKLQTTSTLTGKSLSEQVKVLKNFTYIIEVK